MNRTLKHWIRSRIFGDLCKYRTGVLCLLCVILTLIANDAQAQQIVTRDDTAVDPGEPLIDGLELNVKRLFKLKHKIIIADWSQYEIDAYYEVLKLLRETPLIDQKKLANQNRSHNIELYRDQAQRIHDRDLEKYENRFKEDSITQEQFSKFQRRLERAYDARLKVYEKYKNDPRTFTSFAMLFHSIDKNNPYNYHGKLVTLSGRIQRLISFPARKNRQGIEKIYEAWIYTDDSQHNPTVVVMTSKPEGMPEGENIYESGTVTGIFFKMHLYTDSGENPRMAPMILAQGIQWKPTAKKETSGWLYGILIGSVVLIMAVTIGMNIQDRRMKKRHREIENPQTKLTEISADADPKTHLAELEKQDRSTE